MRSTLRSLCLTTAAAVLTGLPYMAHAQEPPPSDASRPSLAQAAASQDQAPPAGYVSAIEGAARLDREGALSDVERGAPIIAGDRVRTDAGRVEITLSDGSRLHLDRFSEIEFPSDLVVRLARGRLLVAVRSGAGDRVSVEAPGALARLDEDGQYRVAVGGDDVVEVELAVLRGSAELSSEGGAERLASGQRARVRDGEAPSRPDALSANATTLERWADELTAGNYQGGQTSEAYLPAELTSYAPSFDQYGSWQTDATYGYVWYPSVAVDWRPYYNGRWDHMRGYGWTWITADPWWGYPTHHYGRWQLSFSGSWFWVPSRHWGPAWVYWATTPTYVGWCPLGWNGRPVVNVFAYGGTVHSYGRGRDPYRAWTVMPTGHFGRTHVPSHRVERTVLDRDQPTFVMQHVAPGFAPPRSPSARTTRRADNNWGAPVRRPGGYVASAPRTNGGDTSRAASRVTDPGPHQVAPLPYEREGAPSRTPYGSATSRTPRVDSSGGWSNYREYERRMREQRQPQSGGRDDNADGAGERSPGSRAPAGYTRPADPGPRPDAGRSTPSGQVAPPTGYASPRSGGDRGGDRSGSAPRSSGGGNDARGGGGGASGRSGDSGGSRVAAPRRP